MAIADEIAEIPAGILAVVRGSLDDYRHYRETIARCRDLGRRVGGGSRYVDECRTNRRVSLLQSARCLREFVATAREIGVDGPAILRELSKG